jgi:ABC-type multidrug transport system ATPase subunit
MKVINAAEIVKKYGVHTAVSNVDLTVAKGEIHGLVGPNGAGKSTLIKCICTLLTPDSGSITVCGFDSIKDKEGVISSIGYVGEENQMYEDMKVEDYLMFFGKLHNLRREEILERIQSLSERLDFRDRLSSKIGELSRGYKRRVSFGRAIIHDPPILLLDEFTSGLDPVSAHEMREHISDLRKSGKTFLFSTHNLHEAEIVCDKITILNKGEKIASGTLKELVENHLKNEKTKNKNSKLEKIFFKSVKDKSSLDFS